MYSYQKTLFAWDDCYQRVFQPLDDEAETRFGQRYTLTHKWRSITDILLLPAISSASRVLEIGPSITGVLIKEMTGASVDALCIDELNRNFLDTAGIPLYCCDITIETPSCPPNAYDIILFCEVIEHFTRPPLNALKTIVSLLKKNGTILFSAPNFASAEKRMALLCGKNPQDSLSPENVYYAHLREPVLREAREWWMLAGANSVAEGYTDYDQRDYAGPRIRQVAQALRHANWPRLIRILIPSTRRYFYQLLTKQI
jgi:SAM-dependent methyltransferase